MDGDDKVSVEAELLEKPLPSPRRDPLGYACARSLEAFLEAVLALEFLGRGYTRNAAGKVFQAWKALVGALLALEREKLNQVLSEKERVWLERRGLLRIPTGSLKPLAQKLEEIGYKNMYAYTSVALQLHAYQYHGPDPTGEVSGYPTRESAARDILLLLRTLVGLVEEKLKPRLEERKAWKPEHQRALEILKQKLRVMLT